MSRSLREPIAGVTFGGQYLSELAELFEPRSSHYRLPRDQGRRRRRRPGPHRTGERTVRRHCDPCQACHQHHQPTRGSSARATRPDGEVVHPGDRSDEHRGPDEWARRAAALSVPTGRLNQIERPHLRKPEGPAWSQGGLRGDPQLQRGRRERRSRDASTVRGTRRSWPAADLLAARRCWVYPNADRGGRVARSSTWNGRRSPGFPLAKPADCKDRRSSPQSGASSHVARSASQNGGPQDADHAPDCDQEQDRRGGRWMLRNNGRRRDAAKDQPRGKQGSDGSVPSTRQVARS